MRALPRLPLLLLLALSACARAPKTFFPIGLFAVRRPASLSLIKEAGFDAFQVYERDTPTLEAMAKEAGPLGLRMLAHPFDLMQAGKPAPRWSMAAWYLQDEPDVVRMDPKYLAELRAKVKAWDPAAPTAFVVGDGHAAARFADGGDILMVDWYPVPHLPLESVGEHVRLTVEAAKGRPVWAVLQAYDWGWEPPRDPKKPPVTRFPTQDEIRYMSYLSLAEGARGLWYFALEPGNGIVLSDRTELWLRLTAVSRELAQLRPVFEDGEALGPTPGLPPGMVGRTWRHGGRLYHVLVNTQHAYREVPARFAADSVRPLFEQHRRLDDILIGEPGKLYLPFGHALVLEERG